MIYVIGIGPGDVKYGLRGNDDVMEKACAIIGAQRQIESVPEKFHHKGVIAPKKLGDLETLIRSYDVNQDELVLLASGDPFIYGLGKWLSQKFAGCVQVMPGISSMQYMASKIALPMNDAFLTSSHAKTPNFDLIMSLDKVFMVTDEQIGPYQIAQEIIRRGLKRTVYIGENLSYPDERISQLEASEVENRQYEMNVVVIVNEG
ncbi:cobalt-precorrin-7 (C(5))-methyltransferase [Granulicatella sp. WM01]|nr:cobalt-precorrin-7 (C(5))-methyltransferase [Granulicatella sp. WM01]